MIARLALIGLFGALSWPWLLRGNLPADPHERARLLARLDLADDLPDLRGWIADAGFLNLVADRILDGGARSIIEIGSGTSTLVAARALAMVGGGALISLDTHPGHAAETASRLRAQGLSGDVRHLGFAYDPASPWGIAWGDLDALPDRIDLLVVDGPPWFRHPFIRGAAEALFDRLTPGGAILLDDAARPGERLVAQRWRQRWPDIDFRLLPTMKGALIGIQRGLPAPAAAR